MFNILKEFTSPVSCQPPSLASQQWVDSLATAFEEKINIIYRSFPEKIETVNSRDCAIADYVPMHSPNKFNDFKLPSQEEVLSVLGKIKSGSPLDPIPAHVLNCISATLAPSLTQIYKKSILSATVPSGWKKALVRPIIKKANIDSTKCVNYRPISLLPLFGKILEALVNHQLTLYLESNKILDPSQSGFRASHSTETALVEVVDNIRLSLDSRQSAILVLLDLSAAFDTISHNILIKRLTEIGIGGAVLEWFESYLANRLFRVQLDDFISPNKIIDKGVPQGSILSPTLFNVYVAPLAKIIQSFGFSTVSYADDTQLLITWENDVDNTIMRFKHCMLSLHHWMSQNCLQLNTGKTEILLFGSAKLLWSPDWWPSSLGICPEPKDKARNLGVLLDNTLTMRDHTNSIIGTCYGLMRSLRRIFKWIPLTARLPLIQGLIMSRLDYGNALLMSAPMDLLTKLQVVQNTAARLALDLPPRTPSAPTLAKLHWLPIRKRILFKVACSTHKALFDNGPKYLNSKCNSYVPSRPLRSRDKHLMSIPRIRTVRNGGRSFSYCAPVLWNSLPLTIRLETDFGKFRRLLKTHLF